MIALVLQFWVRFIQTFPLISETIRFTIPDFITHISEDIRYAIHTRHQTDFYNTPYTDFIRTINRHHQKLYDKPYQTSSDRFLKLYDTPYRFHQTDFWSCMIRHTDFISEISEAIIIQDTPCQTSSDRFLKLSVDIYPKYLFEAVFVFLHHFFIVIS